MKEPDFVLLVDREDHPTGAEEKMKAHIDGKLHRAFSVLLFNENGELLLQQRAHSKYHSGGLWTNCCCSHPKPGEDTLTAVKRRLHEELFIEPGEQNTLQKIGQFIYYAELDNGLTEHELDHIYIGFYPHTPKINPDEAMNYRWSSLNSLREEILKEPEHYTFWFKEIISQFCSQIEQYIHESLQKRNI